MLSQKAETAVDLLHQTEHASEAGFPNGDPVQPVEAFAQANQLEARDQIALIRRLMTRLKTDQLQEIVEFGQQEIATQRNSVTAPAALERRTTCLLLKKDYTYQDRGLSEPTQYYVYLRRRKPKLDRYIGTLFYIPKGCTLSYFPDAEGRIFFNPPHNLFQLRDSKNPLVFQAVRLICLEPPPPDYTFTKQQDDIPKIYLRLEYLDPQTFQPLTEASYPFPACMYEGGKLDRYRWEVSAAMLPSESAMFNESCTAVTSGQTIDPILSQIEVGVSLGKSGDVTSRPPRRVIELPPTSSTFYLANRSDSTAVLERMRLWMSWSEKAMPQSRWEIVQNGAVYTLRNASFKRKILSFSQEQMAVTLENSLPVVVKWFQDLGLAVSQAQNQKQYSSAQLKLARNLFVDMSLPQDKPLMALKNLFGVEFTKTNSVSKPDHDLVSCRVNG